MSTELQARPGSSGGEIEGAAAAGSGPRSASAPDQQLVEPRAQTVPEMFQQTVAGRPLQPAMMFKSGGRWNAISWEQYAQGVKRMAGYLMSQGFAPGERGAILSYNRPEWHIADLAIGHLGGCVVGIYLTNSASQCQYILDHAEAPLLFVENRDQLAKVLQVKTELSKLKRIVLISGDKQAADGDLVTTWKEALNLGDDYNMSHAELFDKRWRSVKGNDMATFIYTSGTTGPPKAVMLDHSNVCWTVESLIGCTTLTDPDVDVMISYLPLAHIAERMAGHMLNVYNGHRLYFAEDLANLGANVRDARPTFMFGVPRIWEKYQGGIEAKLVGGGIKGRSPAGRSSRGTNRSTRSSRVAIPGPRTAWLTGSHSPSCATRWGSIAPAGSAPGPRRSAGTRCASSGPSGSSSTRSTGNPRGAAPPPPTAKGTPAWDLWARPSPGRRSGWPTTARCSPVAATSSGVISRTRPRPGRPWTRMAGCTPATWACWTPTAT